MDVNSRDPSQNIIPFRIKGVEVARFDICGNLGIGTIAPGAKLDVAGNVKISGDLFVNGRALNSLTSGVVINMDSQPAPATALNRQKKQSIPIASASTLSTSDIIAKMSGVSVGKTQTYGVGAGQMASYGNIVVAVGSGTNSIAYSLSNPPTASSWVGIPNSANTFMTQGWNITYANGTWVAVGEGTNSIAYSTMTPPVASSWVGIPTGSSFNGVVNTFGTRGYDIAYGNGAWVAVGVGTNSIAYSLANPPTAESWVAIPTSFSPTLFTLDVSGITFGNGTWVATGSGTNGIAYSTRTPPTADSWVVVPLGTANDASVANVSSTAGVNVIYAAGVWLAAGNGTNTLCYSVENPPIASSWMPITTGVLFGTSGRSLAYGNGTWVACGNSTTLLAYSTARIPHSSSWVSMKGPTPSSPGEIINNVTFNASTNTWYFMGDISSNCMFYSTATPPVPATWIGIQRSAGAFTTQAFGAVGITTNAFTAPINVARLDNKVTFPANRMIAVGGGGGGIDVVARSSASPAPATTGTISYSDDDGATWSMVPGGATNAMFSSAADIAAGASFGIGGSRGANAVAWNGEKWVAGGNGRTNSLAFSDDGGMTWTGITGKSVFSVEARDVAWNGRMWVAVGRGIVFSTAYSYDGVTWMGPVDASGVPVNVFSYDIAGPTVTASMSDISGGGISVVWTGNMWVATGTRTLIAGSSPAAYYTVAYSVDGKTWTGAADSGATSTGFDMYAHGIAWNGRNLVATGCGTVNTLAFSTDGTSWVGLGNTVFSVWGRGITWGARRWMATGRGTNTVAFSTNGRNWQGCGANVFKPLRRFMAMGDTGLYTGVASGQPQRGVAFSYSDDGVTWDAPVVNQGLEFSTPIGGTSDAMRSVIFTNQMLLSNAISDNASQHTALMYSTDAGASWSRVPGSSDTEANGGTGMTTSYVGCYSLAANPTRTRFIAGGGISGFDTRKVYFSNDGFNWNRSVSNLIITPQMTTVYASLWVGGVYNRWLIGGSDASTSNSYGRIMYSGDADAVAAWITASPSTFTITIISCFAANTDFSVILAGVASGNTIYRAVNNGGATWTTTSISSTPLGSVRSIAFSPSLGRWVAVGGGGGAANTIIYSTDATGSAWIASPIQAKSATTAIFKTGSEATRVIWDALGGRFLVGGWNGGASDYASLTNVAGLDSVNNNPGYTMAYSADGINWTPVTVRSSDASTSSSGSTFGPFMTRCRDIMALDVSGEYTPINTGYSVTWNSYANRFVATGNGTTPVVYSSDGGVTWTAANQQPPQQAIAVAGGAGAAAGTGTISPIAYTIDGKTWSQAIGAKEVFGSSPSVLCVKYGQTSTAISPNGRIWVAGASNGSNSCLAFSQNGIRWTAIASANTMIGTVRAITYAPAEQMRSTNAALTAASGVGNGVWVAGGVTTNSLIFSYDGISWSEVPGSLAILTSCNAIAFGNGVFVAGGSAGTTDTTAVLAYSTDGINWQPIRGTKSRISTSAVIQCITYGRDERGRGLWVAGATYVSGNPTITLLYSYNGIDWIGVNDSSTLSASINGIAYGVSATTGQGLWVASVYKNIGYSFLFSTTGREGWNTVTNTKTGLFEPSDTGATGIAYSNGVWYATGVSAGISTGRTLAYSYDGSGGWFGVYPSSNMYGTVIPTFSATSMNCVATTNDYMVPCVGAVPAAMVPIRSIGWTAGVGSAYLQHPAILFGPSSTGATAISTDGGRSWGGSSLVSLGSSAFRGGVCNDAFWNGSIWAAVGYDAVSGAKVATSRDGVTWSQIPAAAVPISGVLYSIMWNGTVWMVGGDGSPTNDANTASIAWSTDLNVWTAVANTDTKLYLVKRISWNGMYWVAVGLGTVSTISYSKSASGLVWEDTSLSSSSIIKTATVTSAVNDVVWGGGRWVAVGRGNDIVGGGGVSILYSADTPVVGDERAEYAITGRRWTGVAASASLFPYGANSVCWNGKRFVATGPAYSSKSGTAGNIIAWSADGISWTGYSTTKTVAPGQRWVAVGSGSAATIATSADGRTWTDVSGSALLFSDISGATTAVVNTMGTGARAVGWNGSSLIVGGARSATTMTETSQLTATATTGRTTIPVCAFIGSGNGVMGGGTTNVPDASFQSLTMRASSSVFITHLDVNMCEASAPWANMWLNTYTDLSATQLFQVTPEAQSFSSALKWNGWSWVANFGMTTFSPVTGEQFGSIWYCTDPLARVGWSVASNYATPRILMGQGGYAALEWNGAAWLACGYDPNNNNLIYTTDKYGATGWTAVTGIVSGGSASFQPVCIASSSRFWVVGGSIGTTSALYYTNDRTGATGWKAISTAGGASVLPGIRITSIGYNGVAWICCGGGGGGSGAPASSISWRVDAVDDIGTGWAAATTSGTSGGIPSNMSSCSAVAYSTGAASPIWMVVGDTTAGGTGGDQIAYTSSLTGSIEWKRQTQGTLTQTAFCRLTGITWTGYSWIASSGAGGSRIVNTTDNTGSGSWNSVNLYSPTMFTNAVTYANIPISLLTTGMVSSAGVGAGSGAMWRGGVGRAQGLLPGGGSETTSVVVRSSNGAEGTTWSQTYSRNFLIAVGGGAIRDANGVGGTNRMAYSYDGGLSWTTNNSAVLTTASGSAVGSIRTVKYGNGIWVAGGDSAGSSGSGNNCLAWSRDGVNWVGAGGTQIFGSAGACYAVCCNDRGRWVAVGGAALTTAGTYTNVSGSIYTMAWSDDGMNWTPILGSRALFGIVCQGVSYGADASGVGMWTAIGRGGAYTGCAYSYDGKTWYLSQTSGSLFGTGVNVLTERYAPVASANWRRVSLSSTGQYQTAVGSTSSYIYTSSDYGVTWRASLNDALRDWAVISVSSTGQYQTAAMGNSNIYTSSDYGTTWFVRVPSAYWTGLSVSSTGQYQSACSGNNYNIYTSSDYGVTWTTRDSTRTWIGISVSSSGQYQSAVVINGTGNTIYVSSDYGLNWVSKDSSRTWYGISISSTGQYQSAIVNGGQIYISSTYGGSWSPVGPSGTWYSISVSSTGKYQSAVVNSGQIYTSLDFGASWTSRETNREWTSISISSTGQYQTAVSTGGAGLIFISSNFGETWQSAATDSRSLGITYGKDATGTGMWVATAGRRDRDVAASAANTMAYSYDGKLWRGITASAGLSEQAWSVAYGKDGFGVGMWVAGGYDRVCGLKWSYDGVTWNATTGASGSAVWVGAAAGRRALSVYWNGSMWLASTSDVRNGEPRGTGIAANNASGVPGYLLYSYNGKNWLPVLAANTYASAISATVSVYSVLPNPAILDFGSFYDDQTQRGVTITNTTARTVGAVMSGGVPIENVNTIVPYGRGSLTTGQVPFLLGGDSGLMDTGAGTVGVASGLPITSELAASTTSLSTSTDGGITWRAVPNSTRVMTKVNKILCDETTQQIVAVGTGNYSVATSTPATAGNADGWVGVFGSRMTNTRAGLFEKYGTAATWFGGAKMWIASGRTQSRRGSSLAVSVNGTVWQDAKIVSQTAAGVSLGGRGGGLTSRTTTGVTMTSSVIPYTAPTTPLLTYTDSAAAFSTQVSSIATNSQYNRAVVGGSGVQFVAGGRGGIAVSNDGQNWTAAASGTTTTVFQTPTNVVAYSTSTGSGGFDASFGTVALTQRLTVPATYPSWNWYSVSVSKTGQYQSAVVYGGNIWTSSDFGVTWTSRATSFNWKSISLSSTGQYQTAVVNNTTNSNIWTSSDYGVTWTSRGNSDTWNYVSLSSTGQYQSVAAAVGGSGYIWISSDYGVTWTARTATNLNWWYISLSSTGQYQSAVLQSGNIYISSDFGANWTPQSAAGSRTWRSISLSSTGQYQSAVVYGGNIWTSSDFGVTWTSRATSLSWQSVSLSSTGQYQSAVATSENIWTSSDFGVTWTSRATSLSWRSVSLSSTGQYQTAVVESAGGLIFTSTDFGVTWVQRSTATKTNAFTRIKSSASGQYQLATSGPVGNTNGQLYVSSDYGQTWIPRRGLLTWLGGAVSATGAVMTAFSTPTAATAAIIRSTDYGATFTDVPNTTLTGTAYWRAASMTNSAATQTALAYGSTIYRSSDTGATWNSSAVVDIVGILTTELSSVVSPTYAWKSIAMSSDAKYQTGVVSGSGQIYVNSNYGREAWTAVDSARNWASVSMSADGRYQSAVVTSGAIYYNSTFGTGTWTAVTSPTGLTWTGIAVSSASGQYQTAVASGATNIYVSSNYGVSGSWTSKDNQRNWFGVAVSSTGQYQTAINRSGYIYVDVSFGAAASWTSVLTDTPRDWVSVAMSSTGQYQTAVVASGKIYVNNNYGANGAWTEADSNRAWISVAISGATGRYQTAVAQNAQIYTNATFGMGAWIPVDSSRNWVSVTVSADGKYQSAAVATSGQVYFSRDYGSTWSTTAGLDIMGNRWQDVAVAAETGAVQVTCVSGGYIYYSGDTGATWTSSIVSIDGVSPQTTNRAWQAVALSANGQYGLACVNSTTASGFIYRSLNYGASWASANISIDGTGVQTTNRLWQDVGMSANGKYQVACLNNFVQIAYTSNIASAVGIMVTPPGALATTYGSPWGAFGGSGIAGGATSERSGTSVSLSSDGTIVAIGANNAGVMTQTSNIASTVSVMVAPPGTVATTFGSSWGQLGLDILGTQVNENSGWSVSLSADGTTVAIGFYAYDKAGLTTNANTDEGRVRIYKYNNGTLSWGQLGSDILGTQASELSGYSVSLSADGTTVAIGSKYYDKAGGTADTNTSEGRTRIYKYNNGTLSWAQLGLDILGTQLGEYSGTSVSLSADGTTVAIGSFANDKAGLTTNADTDEGRVRIYKYNNGTLSWGQLGSDILGTQASELSGISVSLSADGTTVAIGSQSYDKAGLTTNTNTNEGRVRIYKLNGTTWGQLGSDILGTQVYELGGYSVSLSADGTTVAIGSPYYDKAGLTTNTDTNEGRVRIYKLNGTTWGQLGLDISGTQANENNGYSVSLSADGTTVAIGVWGYDVTGTNEGRVRIYKYNNGTLSWGQLGLDILGTQTYENSGWSVSLSADGTTVAIGSFTYDVTGTNNEGRVRVYKIPTTNAITYTSSNSSVADIYGNILLIKNAAGTSNIVVTQGATTTNGVLTVSGTTYTLAYTVYTNTGITRIYKYNSGTGTWGILDTGIVGGAAAEQSGYSVSVSSNGTIVAIGAPGANSATGITRIYKFSGGTWGILDTGIVGGAAAEQSGYSVSVSSNGTIVAIGAYSANTNTGITRIYKYNSGTGTWGILDTGIVGGATSEQSGFSVSISSDGTIVAIGAPGANSATGITRIYKFSGGTWGILDTGIVGLTAGEQSGSSVSLSSDGTIVAIGAYTAAPSNTGITRIYKYSDGKWNILDTGIVGGAAGEYSGYRVSLSSDGTIVAIAAYGANSNTGITRIYKYSGGKWNILNTGIVGGAAGELSGSSVSISSDGTIVAIGANQAAPTATGITRIYKIPTTNQVTYTSSNSSVADICGNLLIIKGTAGTSNIVATQGETTTNGVLTVSGATYTLVYTIGTVSTTSFIYYSKDYGASWTSLSTAGSRSWSSVALSENGGTISATTNDASGAIWTYTMPDDQYYRPPALLNSGSATTASTIRAITYGNSGTGAATDGYWVAGADASANSLAYSSNGVDWTAVVGSKTALFNSVNGVAYGADLWGTMMWVAVGAPFIGSVPGSTAFSIAYSYNMTTWTGVRNLANFTGQGNHVAYGQDEYGTGMWVAVGQGSGVLAANLGSSSFYNSNGVVNTTIFYSYDGANWAAGTGAGVFSTSGTDVAWGVDASGVATWVASGIGFTDPLTGVFIPGGQVAYSTNGRVWTPIRAPTAIVPALTPTTLTSRVNVTPPPPASTGFVTSTFGTTWAQLGLDILGTQASEQSGLSVALSADGMTVAIGSYGYDVTGTNNEGRTRIYKYNNGTSSWGQLGLDISGTQVSENSGYSVSLSADGTTVAIGSRYYDKAGLPTNADTDEGRVRIYKYNKNGTLSWDLLGSEILGTQVNEYSGFSVALSADGTTVAIGSPYYNVTGADEGRVRIYKLIGTTWTLLGVPPDILGTQVSELTGISVSLSADGTTVAIGSYGYDKAGGTANSSTDEGRVRIYKLIGTTWTLLGSEILGNQANEQSGWSVSLSADGTTVAIGSTVYDKAGGTTNAGTDEGRVRIYKLIGTTWTLLGSEILGTQVSENSGYSVSLSADGTTVAIGSQYYDKAGGPADNHTEEGRVRIYKLIGTTWTLLGSEILGTQASEYSGYSVSLSADGTTVAIGSPYYDKAGLTTDAGTNEGRVRIYKLDITGAFFSSSNPAVADIIGNSILSIKDISAGTTTITATQPAYPPFSLTPAIVQGTLTVTGTVYTLVYHTVFSTFTPFSTSALSVAYGRGGSQGTGAPLWIVGGSGGNVFAAASRPSATDAGIWSVVSAAAPTANAPFPTCSSLGYSNGIWVAGNNTDATNVLARSIDGGGTWTPVPLSSVSGILAGSASVGANAFCNYSLAYADYSNDTNMRSWVAVQGTKNFMFEGGVNTVATVSSNIVPSAYNSTNRAWWVAGGAGTSAAGVSGAALAYSTDPSGASGWTKSTSPAIASLAAINDIAFSPQTQRWLAVGAGASGSSTQNVLFSDASGATWTASAVATPVTPVITLNTCIWNQLDASASAAGRWLAGGTRNDISVSISTSASLYISTDTSGAASPWTPIAGTGAILSQVYSAAFNGRVWIAAGVPATDVGSTSTLMRTSDPTGATGWTGITTTASSISGFDTAARSIAWNADQQMWVATGENTGTAADASFSSVIYSLDVNGSVGTWRTVRESNSSCFSGQGNGIAFTGRKWLAVGEGTNQIVATTDISANTVFGTGAAPTWSSAGNANTTLPVRGTDIAFTGRNLIATGVGSGTGSGVVISTDPTGTSWSSAAAGFTDASGGGTSITFEPTFDGTGRLVATGKSATNSISVSSDSGATWNTSATATATAVQFSSRQQTVATTQTLFTTGGNSVAYVGNDTLFGGGGNDVHWSGKRWIATGKNSGADAATTTATATAPPTAVLDIINNNTAPIAVSDDGITWQCVSSGQAPNITEGMFVATNSRIGATPLIDSRITIMDGGDTEITMDYGGGGGGGGGGGIAQVDIIAELPVTSVSASNTTGSVTTIGVGSNNVANSANGVGVTPPVSFDNTAFTITTRPI